MASNGAYIEFSFLRKNAAVKVVREQKISEVISFLSAIFRCYGICSYFVYRFSGINMVDSTS
jgi:hypothetical protein